MALHRHKSSHKSSHKTKATLQSVGHELKENPPAILAKTRRKSGEAAANRQEVAILLSKARKRGARIKGKPMGSGMFTDAEMMQGFRRLG